MDFFGEKKMDLININFTSGVKIYFKNNKKLKIFIVQ